MGINYGRLIRLFEERGEQATADIRVLFKERQIRPEDFDLGKLFVECFGYSAFVQCRARERFAADVMSERLQEAEGAVTTSAFQNISGQIIYNAVLEPYQDEEYVFSRLIPETPTNLLDGEKIAGITEIGDELAVRNENEPYAIAGVGENWITTPAVKDRGVIIPVTWEAVFNDRTGRLLDRCRDVGKWGAVNKEKRAIDCCVDENVTAHRYNWRTFGQLASYDDNTGNHTWDNLAASNGLVDWTDIDAAEQLFNAMTDPFTGEPILFGPRHLTVTKSLEQTARRIVSATEIRVATPGYATTGNPTLTNMDNPYRNKYEVVTSRLLASRMATDTSWFLADWSQYATYMVAEAPNVQMAPPNSHEEWHRRVVQQFRFNERGAYVVREPRAAVKNTA